MTESVNCEQPRRALDLVHLARQTLGDRALESEVLRLFATQSRVLLARLQTAEGEERRQVAHTLKGSARAVGAWEIAEAAATIEGGGAPDEAQLASAIDRANALILELAA